MEKGKSWARYKPALLLLGFFIAYFLIINIWNTADLHSDEARHSAQGLIFVKYFEKISTEGHQDYRNFVDDYFTGKYPQSGFYALYDPPLHAFIQAIFFYFFGGGLAVARISSQLIVGGLLVFVYLMFRSVFTKYQEAIGATVLFFLLPFTFVLAREAMLAIPVALLTAGWYYFTFGRTKKVDVKEQAIRIIGGGFCLTAASLMMYQTLVYLPLFMVAYTVIELIRKKKAFFTDFFNSTVFFMLIQSTLCAICMLWWFSISFVDTGILDLILRAGTQEVKGGAVGTLSYALSFITQLLEQTLFLALIGLVALRNKKFVKKHWPMLLLVVVILLSSTLVLSNKQLRYIAHVIPFIIALMVVGLSDIVDLLKKSRKVFWITLSLVCVFLLAFNLHGAYTYSQEQGVHSLAYTWLAQQPLPRTIVSLDITGPREHMPYMHTPDGVVYNLIAIDQKGQSGTFFDVPTMVSLAVSTQIIGPESNLYYLILDSMLDTPEGIKIKDFLTINGFKKVSYYPYTIYFRQSSPAKPYYFASTKDLEKVKELVERGDKYYVAKNYKESAKYFEQAIELNPLNGRLRTGLSGVYLLIGTEYLQQNQTQLAKYYVDKTLRVNPLALDGMEGLEIYQKIQQLYADSETASSSSST